SRRWELQTNVSAPKSASRLAEGSGFGDGVAAGLCGLSLFQTMRGHVLGSMVENLWHAFGAQRILGRPDIAAWFASLGAYQLIRGQLFGSASSLFFYALVTRQMAAMEQARTRGFAAAAPKPARPASSGPSVGSGSDAGTGTTVAGLPPNKTA